MNDPSRTACHCADFSRAELLRAGAAEAGRGLPAIEPGMPLPAGTGLSRRSFLMRSAGMALAVYGGGALAPQAFEEGIAGAAAATPDQRVLVSIFLSGGADSLSMLAPVGHAAYASLRPSLAIPADAALAFAEDTSLQWHPELAPLRQLHAERKVTVMPAIGYSSPNQSHFTSRHFWEVGELDGSARFGWLGRFLDRHGAPDNPLQGLAVRSKLAPALAPSSVPVAAVARPESYGFAARDVSDAGIRSAVNGTIRELGEPATSDAQLTAARLAARNTGTLRGQLEPLQGTTAPWQTAVAYPSNSGFARELQTVAEMLSRGMPLRCVALSANGGYDTHSSQAATLPNDLRTFAQSLTAFQRDLEARGLADRVLTHVWSEFGRRAKENGSGTDHGAAGVSFVVGQHASGTMVGEFPGLSGSGLDSRGNLVSTVDFRGVYCSLLEQWFGVDPAPIIPNAAALARPRLVAA